MNSIRYLFISYCIALSFSVTGQYDTTGLPTGAGISPSINFGPKLGPINGPSINIPYNPSNQNPNNNEYEFPPHHTRTIFWVHGLGGSTDSWVKAADATGDGAPFFPGRRVECITQNMTYSQGSTLLYGGLTLKQNIDNAFGSSPPHGSNQTDNFIIAHSQGGIVSRAMFHRLYCMGENQGEPFGANGLVTFGTAHQGARILNNKSEMLDALDAICRTVGGAYAYHTLTKENKVKFPIWHFAVSFEIDPSGFIDPNVLTTEICNLLKNNVYGVLEDSFTPAITNDASVPDPNDPNHGINIINQQACESNATARDTMHKMAFYGVEDENGLFFRTLKYFLQSPNDWDYFTADPDEDFLELAREELYKYEGMKAEMYTRYRNTIHKMGLKGCNQWPWSRTKKCIDLKRRAKRIEHGMNLLDQSTRLVQNLDEHWKTIIGAAGYDIEIEKYCVCYDNFTEVSRTKIADESECDTQPHGHNVCWIEEIAEKSRWKKDSDGVVLAESAADLPLATSPAGPIKMIETSHMQMRNNSELRVKLTKLYDGEYDRWFRCEED